MVGVVGTYLYSTAKAFSGVKNLAISALAGIVLNRIGDAIYKYYQKRYVEKKSVKEITKDAIEHATKV